MKLLSEFQHSIHPQLVIENDYVTECNDAFLSATGYQSGQIVGQALDALLVDDKELLDRICKTQLFESKNHPVQLLQHNDSTTRPVQIELTDAGSYQIASFRLLNSVDIDPITSLPMGWMVDVRATQFFTQPKKDAHLGYVIARIDNFAAVNFRYSYAVGDAFLVKVAQILQQVFGPEWVVGRFNGAKFGLMHTCTDLRSKADYHQYISDCCQRLCNTFADPIELDGLQIKKQVSIGANSNASLYESFKTLDIATETAYVKATEFSSSSIVFATNDGLSELVRRKMLIDDLHTAVEHNQIHLVYQPLYHVSSRQVIGFEALARWQHKTLGNVSPVEFIGIAENIGYYLQLDLYILHQACQQVSAWLQLYGKLPRVAVNFSAKTFQSSELIEQVRKVFTETQCPPSCIEIEITETADITHFGDLLSNVDNLGKMNIQVVLDDFGAGYNSLQLLRSLAGKVDKIKIDREFMNDIFDNDFNKLLFKQTIEMAHMLKIDVLAEGIEDADQLALLERYGCDLAQGYYLHKPASVDALNPLLNKLRSN